MTTQVTVVVVGGGEFHRAKFYLLVALGTVGIRSNDTTL